MELVRVFSGESSHYFAEEVENTQCRIGLVPYGKSIEGNIERYSGVKLKDDEPRGVLQNRRFAATRFTEKEYVFKCLEYFEELNCGTVL